MEEKLKEVVVVNTGHISFLKVKGIKYNKRLNISRDQKGIVEFVFIMNPDELSISEGYWQGEQLSAIDFKRELDSTKQEIEDVKNNRKNYI